MFSRSARERRPRVDSAKDDVLVERRKAELLLRRVVKRAVVVRADEANFDPTTRLNIYCRPLLQKVMVARKQKRGKESVLLIDGEV